MLEGRAGLEVGHQQAGGLGLGQERRVGHFKTRLGHDVALAGQNLGQQLVGVGDELEGDGIQIGQALIGAIVVLVTHHADAVASDPLFDDERAIAHGHAARFLGLQQFGGREPAQEVLRQRLPEIDEVGRVAEAGQARPADAQIARRLIAGGTLGGVLGGRGVRVDDQVETVHRVGGIDRGTVGPDGGLHRKVGRQLVHHDRRAVEGHFFAVRVHDHVARGQRTNHVANLEDDVAFVHFHLAENRVTIFQARQLLQGIGLEGVGERGDVVLLDSMQHVRGGQHRATIDVQSFRLLGLADHQVFRHIRGFGRHGGHFDDLLDDARHLDLLALFGNRLGDHAGHLDGLRLGLTGHQDEGSQQNKQGNKGPNFLRHVRLSSSNNSRFN